MDTQQHSFRRPDGSVLTITSKVGEGRLSEIGVEETEPAREPALEPEEDALCP